MKIDPYNSKESWIKWKKDLNSKIQNLSKENSEIIINYLDDMGNGLNVASGSKKGARSYHGLNTLKIRSSTNYIEIFKKS